MIILTRKIASNIHAVAEALLLLLSYTPDPVIPYRLQQNCIAASNYNSCKQVFDILVYSICMHTYISDF